MFSLTQKTKSLFFEVKIIVEPDEVAVTNDNKSLLIVLAKELAINVGDSEPVIEIKLYTPPNDPFFKITSIWKISFIEVDVATTLSSTVGEFE